MKLKQVKIGAKSISVEVVKFGGDDSPPEVDKITCPSRPMDEFSQAFANLEDVFCQMFEVPAKWKEGLVITGLTITDREDGEVSAIIRASREFLKGDAKLTTIKTPAFVYIADDPHCNAKGKAAIEEAINRANGTVEKVAHQPKPWATAHDRNRTFRHQRFFGPLCC